MPCDPLWRALGTPLFLFPLASKLEISFSSKEICSLLSDCCRAILPLPSAAEQTGEIGNAEEAVLQLQVTCCPFPAHLSVRTPPQHKLCAGSSRDPASPSLSSAFSLCTWPRRLWAGSWQSCSRQSQALSTS